MCFESNFEYAAKRKTAKYTDLVDQACTNGYNTTLLTLVGSRGVPHYESFAKLATVLHMPARDLMNLLRNVIRAAMHHWLFYYLVFQEQIIIATCHLLLLCFFRRFFFFLSFRKVMPIWQFCSLFHFLWYQCDGFVSRQVYRSWQSSTPLVILFVIIMKMFKPHPRPRFKLFLKRGQG